MHVRANRLVLGTAAAFALAFPACPVRADDTTVPPDPGVARISVAQGNVDVSRADAGDTFLAAVNAPLSAGDYVTTDDTARAEVEFDYGSALRIAPHTQLRFTTVAPSRHELQLAQGTVDLRVFRGLAAHPEIETPDATIRPAGNGSFRVTVTDDGATEVTARSGRVLVVTTTGTQTLEPGPTLSIVGDPNDPQVATIDPVAQDSFDAFNRSRDAYVERSHDFAYVDAGFVGADDLDAYGQWTDVDGYGEVWQPTAEPAGWVPYSTGRWVWEPYYGWTWVDDAPWGYAPYHYGRWFYANANWYWTPGITVAGRLAYGAPVVYYPHPQYYRPALVAFFSFGGGVSFGFGSIGWVALGPAEPFRPWYGPGANVTANVSINVHAYRNWNAPGAVVAVDNGSFARGNFAHVAAVRGPELANAAAVRGVVPIVPTHANLAFNAHAIAPLGAGVVAPPRFARFARFATPPPKAAAATFTQQQRAVESAALKSYPDHATAIVHPDERSVTPPTDPFARFDRTPATGAPPAYAVPETHDKRTPTFVQGGPSFAPVTPIKTAVPAYRPPAGSSFAPVTPLRTPVPAPAYRTPTDLPVLPKASLQTPVVHPLATLKPPHPTPHPKASEKHES